VYKAIAYICSLDVSGALVINKEIDKFGLLSWVTWVIEKCLFKVSANEVKAQSKSKVYVEKKKYTLLKQFWI
jgi:hypothetical protein